MKILGIITLDRWFELNCLTCWAAASEELSGRLQARIRLYLLDRFPISINSMYREIMFDSYNPMLQYFHHAGRH